MPEKGGALTLTPEQVEDLRRLRRDALRRRRRIAVVGLACRFPDGAGARDFWKQLRRGGNAVSKGFPRSRNPRGTSDANLFGAFVHDVDRFDSEFFRIAPVEAQSMDPQQRLLLETSWEALEDAGLDPDDLKGSRTGVYVGICNNDYRTLVDRREWGLYEATGTSLSTAAGRVAFTLGLNGPAIAVDTACSSSLVAIHLAVAALQRGEADLAFAGGANAMLIAETTVALGRTGMLSPDGRCKTFDAAADGYVRGEGCGVLVLKRLADAERDGDRILGVVLGSAVNQDGASAGLTVPNGPAQERVIREALERAGIEGSSVDYLEAHGTGTELGDPIEVQAAAAAYGEGRDPECPLLMGSVKTNVGHLEGAAGVAGVIKTLLAMRARVIPKHLHFERPNPRIPWEELPVRVTAEATPWPTAPDRPLRAGVSSFGFSGTNAHVILEGYGPAGEASGLPVVVSVVSVLEGAGEVAAARGRRVRVLPLSGRSVRALSELAGRYLSWLGEGSAERSWEDLSDAAWTAGVGRRHFGEREGVLFSNGSELREQLTAMASSGVRAGSAIGIRAPGKVGFLFTGQGSQWVGMGKDLYEAEPVARGVLDRCEEVMREERGASLLGVMFGEEDRAGDLDSTEWTQPALYALELALVALWRSVGVEPDAVLGHSVGELAAAQAAGVFGLEEGLRFASHRGELMGSLPREGEGAGGMVAVFAAPEAVSAFVSAENEGVSGVGLAVAAENGSHQVVSGPLGLLAMLEERLRAEGVRTERLRTSHAFHSGLMDPILNDLRQAGSAMTCTSPSIPLVSGVTGAVARPSEAREGAYWRRQARAPVRFAEGVRTLSGLGVGVLMEIGPRAVLGPLAAFSWPAGRDAETGPLTAASQRGMEGEGDRDFARAVAQLYQSGLPVSFAGLYAGERRCRVSLPSYPFQRERHWVMDAGRRSAASGHPLLGERRELPGGEVSFEIPLSELQWLSEHRVFGRVIAPAALYGVQGLMALRSSGSFSGSDSWRNSRSSGPWSRRRRISRRALGVGNGSFRSCSVARVPVRCGRSRCSAAGTRIASGSDMRWVGWDPGGHRPTRIPWLAICPGLRAGFRKRPLRICTVGCGPPALSTGCRFARYPASRRRLGRCLVSCACRTGCRRRRASSRRFYSTAAFM